IAHLTQRDLLSLRTASRPDAKVNTSISARPVQRPRQSLVSATFKPLDFVLVRPRCGKLRRCHKGLLSGIEKAPTVTRGGLGWVRTSRRTTLPARRGGLLPHRLGPWR